MKSSFHLSTSSPHQMIDDFLQKKDLEKDSVCPVKHTELPYFTSELTPSESKTNNINHIQSNITPLLIPQDPIMLGGSQSLMSPLHLDMLNDLKNFNFTNRKDSNEPISLIKRKKKQNSPSDSLSSSLLMEYSSSWVHELQSPNSSRFNNKDCTTYKFDTQRSLSAPPYVDSDSQ